MTKKDQNVIHWKLIFETKNTTHHNTRQRSRRSDTTIIILLFPLFFLPRHGIFLRGGGGIVRWSRDWCVQVRIKETYSRQKRLTWDKRDLHESIKVLLGDLEIGVSRYLWFFCFVPECILCWAFLAQWAKTSKRKERAFSPLTTILLMKPNY